MTCYINNQSWNTLTVERLDVRRDNQFSRQIVGFAVHTGDCDGMSTCRMFNSILAGKTPPKYLSTDNDPLFAYHRWKANLSVLDVEELKSVPNAPTSHPFIERLIGTIRREYLDQTLFFNSRDLQNKLDQFKKYYNEARVHSSLDNKTPLEMEIGGISSKEEHQILNFGWQSHCNGLYKLPTAALN